MEVVKTIKLKNLNIKKGSIIAILLLILLVGLFLRLYHLDKECIWYDESYTILSIQQPTLGAVLKAINVNELYAPPLYYIIMHFWIKSFGSSEFALRFFSLVFGILSVFLVYKIGKKIFNYKVGLIASFIISTSMINVLYSQEARTYSFFAFLALLSSYYFINILKHNKSYAPYIISTLLALYTLQFGVIVLFLQNLVMFFFYFEKKDLIRKWLLTQLAIFVLYVPYLPNLIKTIKLNAALNLILLVKKYNLPAIVGNVGLVTALALLASALTLLFVFVKKDKIRSGLKKLKFNEGFFLILLALIFAALIFIMPHLMEPLFLTRYALFMLPAFYILISAGISKLKKNSLQILVILVILILNSSFLYLYYTKTTKEDWRAIVGYVEQNSQQNDIVLLIGGVPLVGGEHAFDYYYKGNFETIGFFAADLKFNMTEKKEEFLELQPQINTKTGVWFITDWYWLSGGVYKEIMDSLYKIELEKEFKGIKLYYYKIEG